MERFFPHISWAAFGVAAALLASSIVTYRLSTTRASSVPAGVPSFAAPAPAPPFQPEKNLFGAVMEPEAEVTATEAVAIAPPSKLLVVGVMHGGPRPAAIIRNLEADSVAVFAQGAWVFGRAEHLRRVEPDGVILAGAYGRRRLKVGVMPEEQGPIIETSRPPAATGPGMNVSRAEINASVRSPEELIGASKLVPEVRDGKIVGVRITVVADNSIVRKMGLEANDIVTSVNGQKLDSLERSTQAWEQAKKATEIHMLVERGGQERVMSYYLRP